MIHTAISLELAELDDGLIMQGGQEIEHKKEKNDSLYDRYKVQGQHQPLYSPNLNYVDKCWAIFADGYMQAAICIEQQG